MSTFSESWSQLASSGVSGSFDYLSPESSFRGAVDGHFGSIDHEARFGVYVVRRIADNEVLYVGKGGTIEPDGTFKSQNIQGRLKSYSWRCSF